MRGEINTTFPALIKIDGVHVFSCSGTPSDDEQKVATVVVTADRNEVRIACPFMAGYGPKNLRKCTNGHRGNLPMCPYSDPSIWEK